MSEIIQMNFVEMDHEVRVRLLEELVKENKSRFESIEAEMRIGNNALLDKIDSNFHWILGTIISLFVGVIGIVLPIFGGIILHMAKLS